jgi:hypothetical protein
LVAARRRKEHAHHPGERAAGGAASRAFALVLAQLADLEAWPEADRRALADVCGTRWAATELDFIAGTRRHDRLRQALVAAAKTAAK